MKRDLYMYIYLFINVTFNVHNSDWKFGSPLTNDTEFQKRGVRGEIKQILQETHTRYTKFIYSEKFYWHILFMNNCRETFCEFNCK